MKYLLNYMYRLIPDKMFLSLLYYRVFKKKINFSNPITYNEKLQWLKINDRKANYSDYVDKYKVKKIIQQILGPQYIIPTLAVWNNVEEINFENLPNCFVLKCTHDSGSYLIVRDKNSINIDEVKRYFKSKLNQNFYYKYREWPYKNVKPRIIVEQYMINDDGSMIDDIKVQCFNGKVDHIFICKDRLSGEGVKYFYYDRNWKFLPYSVNTNVDPQIKRPENIEEIINLAEKIAASFTQIRVDFYEINKKIYFGELTFYTQSGFDTSITKEADYLLGSRLKLQ